MNNYFAALTADMQGQLMEATRLYEQSIQEPGSPLDAYINLAIAYWSATDFGFSTAAKLEAAWIRNAFERYPEVLTFGELKYPNVPEIRFWQLYTDYISLGKPSFVPECKGLVALPTCSLIPYFYLFTSSGGMDYRDETLRLYAQVSTMPTYKNRYIQSVLRSSIFPSPGW